MSARRRRGIERLNTSAIAAHPAAAMAEWPDGNDDPADPMRCTTVGRSRSISHFNALLRITTPMPTVAMNPITARLRNRR